MSRLRERPGAPSAPGRVGLTFRRIFKGVAPKKLEAFYFQFATMLSAGVPIRDALNTLADQQRGRSGVVYGELAEAVSRGFPLSEALAERPEVFDNLAQAMVKTGEMTGRLDDNLRLVGATLERMRELRSRLITGLAYPIILLHLGVIIPNILVLVKEGLGPFFLACVTVLIPLYAIVVAGWFFHQVFKETKGYGSFLLGMFFIGGVVKKIAFSRFTRALAALYDAGVPLDSAVETAGDTCGNGALAEIFTGISKRLKAGTGLSEAVAPAPLIPDLVKNMIQTGEHSGRLDATLRKVADYYDHEAATAVERAARILPVLIYLMVAGWIAYQVISFWLGYYGPHLGL